MLCRGVCSWLLREETLDDWLTVHWDSWPCRSASFMGAGACVVARTPTQSVRSFQDATRKRRKILQHGAWRSLLNNVEPFLKWLPVVNLFPFLARKKKRKKGLISFLIHRQIIFWAPSRDKRPGCFHQPTTKWAIHQPSVIRTAARAAAAPLMIMILMDWHCPPFV